MSSNAGQPPAGAKHASAAHQKLRARAPRPARNALASTTVVLAAALMAFLAAIALAATMSANRLADAWTRDLVHIATVLLPPGADQASFERLKAEIQAHPGVASIEKIDPDETTTELARLLGGDKALAERLQLSPMLDVRFDAPAAQAGPILAKRLKKAGLSATVDTHGAQATELATMAGDIRSYALTALLVIAATAAMMVALACVSALAAHSEMVDVLRMIGARDGFIASLFERPLQINTFVGSALGAGVAFVVVVMPGAAPPSTQEIAPLLPDIRPAETDWPSFFAIPPAFAIIATAAARAAVAFALRRPEE